MPRRRWSSPTSVSPLHQNYPPTTSSLGSSPPTATSYPRHCPLRRHPTTHPANLSTASHAVSHSGQASLPPTRPPIMYKVSSTHTAPRVCHPTPRSPPIPFALRTSCGLVGTALAPPSPPTFARDSAVTILEGREASSSW